MSKGQILVCMHSRPSAGLDHEEADRHRGVHAICSHKTLARGSSSLPCSVHGNKSIVLNFMFSFSQSAQTRARSETGNVISDCLISPQLEDCHQPRRNGDSMVAACCGCIRCVCVRKSPAQRVSAP